MKTLDEVIKAMTDDILPCGEELISKCPLCENCTDALFYLKEYRWLQDNCADALAEKFPSENEALTWKELKRMEGKPVWVEERDCHYWAVIGKYDSTKNHEFLCLRGLFLMDKDDLGKTWQAYRKERDHANEA